MRFAMICLACLMVFAPLARADENWVSYFRQDAADPVSVFVDLSVMDEGVALSDGVAIVMAVKLADPDSNGMTRRNEALSLFRLEDSMVDRLARLGGRMAGRTTGQGQRVFYVLFPDGVLPTAAKSVLQDAAQEFGLRADFLPESRKPMDVYSSELYPDAAEQRQIGDLRVITGLIAAGDFPAEPRPINHWCVFNGPKQVKTFQEWITAKDYDLEEVAQYGQDRVVRFSHISSIQPDVILAHTAMLDRTCRDMGGVYDGWETTLVSAPGGGAQE